MVWSDLFDAIFGGGSSAPGSFQKFALGQYAAQVPYIGQYLGYYLTGAEDLSELTNNPYGPATDEYGAPSRGIVDEGGGTPDTRGDWLDLVGPQSPDTRLADNSTPKASIESWLEYQPGPLGSQQEITLDTGPLRPFAGAPNTTQGAAIPGAGPEPIAEVVIHGVRPDRPSPAISVPPTYLHVPYRTPIGKAAGRTPPARRDPVPPNSRPELLAPPRAEREDPDTQNARWVSNTVISAQPQFDRDVSDPEALAAAEGRGRIEWGDLVQFTRGGYNGVISAWQFLARTAAREGVDRAVGPMAAPFVTPLVTPYMERPIGGVSEYRLSIDPRYGGAGMAGEQLLENLVFEALPFAPRLENITRKALRSDLLVAPIFSALTAGGVGGAGRYSRLLRLRQALLAREAAHAAGAASQRVRQLGGGVDAQKAAAEAAAARARELVGELDAQNQVAEDILMESGVARPKDGFSEGEILGHLRRLEKEGNPYAAEALRQYTEAIEANNAFRPHRIWVDLFPAWEGIFPGDPWLR